MWKPQRRRSIENNPSRIRERIALTISSIRRLSVGISVGIASVSLSQHLRKIVSKVVNRGVNLSFSS